MIWIALGVVAFVAVALVVREHLDKNGIWPYDGPGPWYPGPYRTRIVVVDADGAPVARARIFAQYRTQVDGQTAIVRRTFNTDREGRLEINDLFLDRGEERPRFQVYATGLGMGSGALGSRSDAVHEEQVRLLAGGRISGRVVLDDGSPLAGARVRDHGQGFADAGRDGAVDPPADLLAGERSTDVTGPDGRFALEDRGWGQHWVGASAASELLAPAAMLVYVGSGRATEVELVFRRRGAVAGRRLDRSGQPAGKQALTFAAERDRRHVRVAVTVSEADGSFRADGLDPGPWRVYEGNVSEDVLWPSARDAFHKEPEEVFLARIGYGPKPLRVLDVPAGATATCDLGEAVLHVSLRMGETPLGGTLALHRRGVAAPAIALEARFKDGRSRYDFWRLPPGSYEIRGRGASLADVEVPAGAEALDLDVALAEGPLAGVVVDVDGRPIAGAGVSAVRVDPGGVAPEAAAEVRARTGADGVFVLRGFAGARYAVLVEAPGRAPVRSEPRDPRGGALLRLRLAVEGGESTAQAFSPAADAAWMPDDPLRAALGAVEACRTLQGDLRRAADLARLPCPRCTAGRAKCTTCGGTGRITRERRLTDRERKARFRVEPLEERILGHVTVEETEVCTSCSSGKSTCGTCSGSMRSPDGVAGAWKILGPGEPPAFWKDAVGGLGSSGGAVDLDFSEVPPIARVPWGEGRLEWRLGDGRWRPVAR